MKPHHDHHVTRVFGPGARVYYSTVIDRVRIVHHDLLRGRQLLGIGESFEEALRAAMQRCSVICWAQRDRSSDSVRNSAERGSSTSRVARHTGRRTTCT